MRLSDLDYVSTGKTLQRAFVEARKAAPRIPKPLREPLSIVWDGRDVITGDIFVVPRHGMVAVELIDYRPNWRQGVDLEIPRGGLVVHGDQIPSLRTWFDPALPERVAYEYVAEDGYLRICNVYEVSRGDKLVEERWTGNSGMWVEKRAALERIYHCSAGPSSSPTFDDVVFTVKVDPFPAS